MNDRSFRRNLTELLQGYVEHCEVSHLIARMDLPIYYHSFKFGAAVFTHIGPSEPKGGRQVIGMILLNGPGSQVVSDVLPITFHSLRVRSRKGQRSRSWVHRPSTTILTVL